MTPKQAWLAAAQWGSAVRPGDPGACMYGFNESGCVQSEEHRQQCLDWIDRHCLPGANKRDARQLQALRRYLEKAPVAGVEQDEPTPVIFKKFEGEVTALFPAEPGDNSPATMSCYAHIGQHGIAHQMWAKEAKPAKPDEYADLLAELRSIGYDNLVIRRRMTRQDYETRKAKLNV